MERASLSEFDIDALHQAERLCDCGNIVEINGRKPEKLKKFLFIQLAAERGLEMTKFLNKSARFNSVGIVNSWIEAAKRRDKISV